MLLIFCSKLIGNNKSTLILQEEFKKENILFEIINPHAFVGGNYALVQKNSGIFLNVSGKRIKPTIIYFANNWRCDSIINIPKCINFPGAYRMRIYQFMQDIRFAFEDIFWIPGKYESIERGDSKPTVLNLAHSLGLSTPVFTCNSKYDDNLKNFSERFYKKNLGSPFVISFSKTKGAEVGVTTTNISFDLNDGIKEEAIFQPWQWQEPISFVAQVRCFVVNNKIWAAKWNNIAESNESSDYRYKNQIKKEKIIWSEYKLPADVSIATIALMKKLSLSIASPEFLLLDDGTHVFIDLNPTGDWCGFFSEEVNREIILALIETFKPYCFY